MTPNNIYYTAVYFKCSVLTLITGELTQKSLKRLKTELRVNASSTDTNLGGGDHGYVGLVLMDVYYACITPTPQQFVPLKFLGPLVINPTHTTMQQIQARNTHNEAITLYRERKNVEKALLRHIQTVVEEKFHRVRGQRWYRPNRRGCISHTRVPLQNLRKSNGRRGKGKRTWVSQYFVQPNGSHDHYFSFYRAATEEGNWRSDPGLWSVAARIRVVVDSQHAQL